MLPAQPLEKFSYELPLESEASETQKTEALRRSSLPEPLLINNVHWFCRLRWVVVAIFTTFGILGNFPRVREVLSLKPDTGWAFMLAAFLALVNIGYLIHAKRLSPPGARAYATTNLWGQIVLDLLVLTAVVHYVGSIETYICFAYLPHIVMSCIFFSRLQSLGVTAIASVLYLGLIAMESAGVISGGGIWADTTAATQAGRISGLNLFNLLGAVGVWIVVWYLTSQLSDLVRERDHELALTNQKLKQAQEERTRHMLHTTHELKAPFAAIQANTQLILKGYCGELSDMMLDVVQRIGDRSRALANAIHDMLQLANLRSESDEVVPAGSFDLAVILRWCIDQVKNFAAQRSVSIEEEIVSAGVPGIEDYLKMLLQNVLSNAVSYSHEGGTVKVSCRPDGNSYAAIVAVEDQGIGIPREKLPHIFDEYYRTAEAARHNKGSTGLGLAIVRHVALSHKIRVRVESAPGAGTRFELLFPEHKDKPK